MVAWPEKCEVPIGTFLAQYQQTSNYVDSYRARIFLSVTLADFIEAFYSSSVFKVERALLGLFTDKTANNIDARALAHDEVQSFAIWSVESRNQHEILLAAGQTRSWLMIEPTISIAATATTLYFGSAVVPRRHGGMGLSFHALLGFHKLYSRALMASAVAKVSEITAHRQAHSYE